ncbi:leucine-rich repeat domain-containing protein [Gottfriedia sp. OAE603]|uniref:leucine-rich repeat domain-containing protein n=1 Tax=Gottfriedia sp. OAE603 TaxID=2663872 RepID=UPI00178ABC93
MILKKIKNLKPRNLTFKLFITIILITSNHLIPLHSLAETNLKEVNNKLVLTLPPLKGEELIRDAYFVDTTNGNRTFTNVTYSNSLLSAAFAGQSMLKPNSGYAYLPIIGPYSFVTVENGRDYLFNFWDAITGSANSAVDAATTISTVIGETYQVTFPYKHTILNERGGETQDIEWGIYASNQVILVNSKKAIASSETGNITFQFKATTSTTYVTMGFKSTSSFTSNGDIRTLEIRGASVKSIKKTIQEIFPDPNLSLVIANYLGLQVTSKVSEEQLASIINLDHASGKNIVNLSGVEYLSNLKSANLSQNQISDVSPLSGLINLKNVNLASNKINDASPLVHLLNLTLCNLSDQKIVLSQGTIRIPTTYYLKNPDGSTPGLNWSYGTGRFENNQITWSSPGDNKLTWNTIVTIGQAITTFSGQISQYTKGFLAFQTVPETISFQTSTITSNETLIQRNESIWNMKVSSDLPGSKWILTASIEKPLTKVDDPTKVLTNAIVYVDQNGTVPLSRSPLKVFEHVTDTNPVTSVKWDADKGILLKPDMNEVMIGTYTTDINWTLIDAP